MNCPEHLLFKVRGVYVWLYWRDVPRETIPLIVWLNPLRYEVSGHVFGRHFRLNKYGALGAKLAYRVNSLTCKVLGHKPGKYFCERCKSLKPKELPWT